MTYVLKMRLYFFLLFSLPSPHVSDNMVADACARKGWSGGGRQATGVREDEDVGKGERGMQASVINCGLGLI